MIYPPPGYNPGKVTRRNPVERTIMNFATADQGIGTLAKAVPRVDPNTDGTQQWDIDAVFGVDEVQADHVAGALPGAGEHLARAAQRAHDRRRARGSAAGHGG